MCGAAVFAGVRCELVAGKRPVCPRFSPVIEKVLANPPATRVQYSLAMFPHITSNEIDLAKSIISLLIVVLPFIFKKTGNRRVGVQKKPTHSTGTPQAFKKNDPLVT